MVRINSDYAADGAEIVGTPTGTSDHDPIVARLQVPAFIDADLAVMLTPQQRPLLGGTVAELPIEIRNVGQGSALAPQLEVTLDAAVEQIRGVTAAGWACETMTSGSVSRMSCGRSAALASGAVETLVLSLDVVRFMPRSSLTLLAAVSTASNDPVVGNDMASVTFRVAGRPAFGGRPRR